MRRKNPRRWLRANTSSSSARQRVRRQNRSLNIQSLESRALLAGDLGVSEPLADITGLWITVGEREYFTSEQASISIDMYAGESVQVTGVRYDVHDSMTDEHGVIAFESYVRREHGAADIGSYDYTNGRFADPIEEITEPGQTVQHPGFDNGWTLEVIDNRIAVVAVRYFEDEFVVEDRLLVDVNVMEPLEDTTWISNSNDVRGQWTPEDSGLAGDSREFDNSGLTVIDTGVTGSDKYEVAVKAKTVEENTWANGFVVLDYHSDNDFVYAGLRSIADRWVIGHFDGQFNDMASLSQDIRPDQLYDLRVAVDGSHVALAADGIFRVGYDFERDLGDGDVGLANQYAYTHFSGFHFFDNSETSVVVAPGLGAAEASVADAEAAVAEERERLNEAVTKADTAAEVSRQAEATASLLESHASEAREAATSADNLVEETKHGIEEAKTRLAAATTDLKAALPLKKEASKENAALVRATRKAQNVVKRETKRSDNLEKNLERLAKRQAQYAEKLEQLISKSEQSKLRVEQLRAKAASAIDAAENTNGSEKAKENAEKAARKAEKLADREESRLKRTLAQIDRMEKYTEKLAGYVAKREGQLAESQSLLAEAYSDLETLIPASEAASEKLSAAKLAVDQARERIAEAKTDLAQLEEQLPELSRAAAEANEAALDAELQATEARVTAAQAAEELILCQAAVIEATEALAIAEDQLLTALEELEGLSEGSSAADEKENDDDSDSHVYSLNFNHQSEGAFETVVGDSELVAGQMHLLPGDDNLAIAVLDDADLPERSATRVYATVRADEFSGLYQNGFIVFDYQGPEDFKYAGAWAGADLWAIGEYADGEFNNLATLDEVIGEGPGLDLQIWIEGDVLSLLVEGVQKLQHDFDTAIDAGQIGVASYNARSRFDQVAVMQLYGGSGDAGIDDVQEETGTNDQAINEMF